MRQSTKRWMSGLLFGAIAVGMSGCADDSPPSNIENACAIYEEREHWYDAAIQAGEKWRVPPATILAIIWRESSFRKDARPPKKRLLGVIPWGRKSSAFGFSQALDGTWDWYKENTGNWGADRDDFDDAADFVGWYMDQSRRQLSLPRSAARDHYLAYHQGHAGYRSGRWKTIGWLKRAASDVQAMSVTYDRQLRMCATGYAGRLAPPRAPVPNRKPVEPADVATL